MFVRSILPPAALRAFLILIFASPLLFSAAGDSVDADSAVTLALARNPDLAAARLTLVEAEGRVDQAGLLSNPSLETEIKPGLQAGQGNLKVGLEQRFPVTSRLRLEKGVSQRLLTAARAEVQDASRKLAEEVRSTVIRIAALQARMDLQESQIATNQVWAGQLSRQAAAGERPAYEADQLRMELAGLKLSRRKLGTERDDGLNHLRQLLALPPGSSLTVTEILKPAAAPGEAEVIVAQRGDFLAAQARLAAANTATDLARSRKWEDITVGVFGEWQRMEDIPAGLQDDQFIGVRVSVPLPFWNRQAGRIREAQAAAQREATTAESLANQIRIEADSARREMAASAETDAEITRELLPAAQAFEEQLRIQVSQGQDLWMQQTRAREKRFELEAAAIEARRDYHLARTRWLSATGQLPLTSTQP